MLKMALKNLLSHKLRMALTGFSVILGVSFVAGTYIFTDTLGKTFDNLFTDVYSGVDVSVRPAKTDLGFASFGFEEAVLNEVQSVEGVELAAPAVSGYAQFISKSGEPIGGQGPPNLGFSWTDESSLNSLKINEGDGRSPQASGEVVMDKATAEANDFSVGDKVNILSAGPIEEFEVVGIATFGDAESLAGATLAAFTLEEGQRLFNLEDQYSIIDIKASATVDKTELKTRIEEILPEGLEAVTGEEQANESLDEFASGLGFINTALLTFAFVAIFVGSFIIQNTFRIIVSQRTKELALLRALGASKLQILKLVVYEALAVGFLASIVGILAGIGIAKLIQVLMSAGGFGIPTGSMVLETRTIVVSMAVGIIVTTLASLLPAIAASRLAPIEALRDSQTPIKRRALVKRGVIGLIMIALGGVALVYGLSGNDISNPLYYVGFGVVLQFIGVSVVAPLLSGVVARSLGLVITRFKGVPAKLAYLNAARSPRRTASTAAALMVGVSLIAFVSILASSFKTAIDDIIAESFSADITVFSNNSGEAGPGTGGFSPLVVDKLETLPVLDTVTDLLYAYSGFEIENDENAFVLAGIEPDTFEVAAAKLKASDGAYSNLGKNSIIVKQQRLEDLTKNVGDSIKIMFAKTGEVEFKIVGSFTENFDSDYLINHDEYRANFNNVNVAFVGATYSNDVEPSVAKDSVKAALKEYPNLEIQDESDLKKTASDQIDQILALMWGLLAMAIIIAVFGITNTLMLSISERTKEIGLLRAIGTTRKQLKLMIRVESIIIAVFGALLGLGMGVFFAWAVIRALNSEGIERMTVSYPQLAVYLVLAVVAGILAAIWPARKAAKMDVLKAISYE